MEYGTEMRLSACKLPFPKDSTTEPSHTLPLGFEDGNGRPEGGSCEAQSSQTVENRKTRFEDLSHDVMACLLEFMATKDVVRLISTGRRILKAKITSEIRILQHEILPFEKFPISFFNFSKLRSLSVKPEENFGFSYNDFDTTQLLSLPALETLTKLELGFWQSFAILLPPINLPQFLPNLEKLHLTGSSRPLTTDMLQALPRTLKSLTLSFSPIDTLPSTITITDLMTLPPQLEEFRLQNTNVQVLENELEAFRLPETLRVLEVRAFTSGRAILHMPKNLEELYFHVLTNHGNQKFELPVSLLPQSLRKCQIFDFTMAFIGDAPMPPHLEEWSFFGLNANPPAELFPRSLQSAPQKVLSASPLATLAERWPNTTNLEVVAFSVPTHEISSNLSELLPRRLTTLKVVSFDIAQLSYRDLPETLTKLEIMSTAHMPLEELPRGIKTLIFAAPLRLPSVPTISIDSWRQLPPRLTDLTIFAPLLESEMCLTVLPAVLSLSLDAVPDSLLSFKDLPKSLRSLYLKTVKDTSQLDFFEHLKDLSNLRILSVLPPTDCGFLVGDFGSKLALLPRTLRSLSISMKGFEKGALVKIPSHLDSFRLSCAEGLEEGQESLRITEDHLKYLPEKMLEFAFLNIPDNFNPQTLPLPPRACRLRLISNDLLQGQTEFRKRTKQYYQAEIWNGAIN